jgi:hypothetical protein
MRIKKKDVILEATLLDVSSEFDKHEKKLLKVLSNKFGAGGYNSDFDRFAAAAWLIEHMDIPYDVAYDLSLTYWWHGKDLFKEYEPVRKKESRGYVFNRMLRNLLEKYIADRGEMIGNIKLKWNDPKKEFSEEETFTTDAEMRLWSGNKGFSIYIPLGEDFNNDYKINYTTRSNATLMIGIEFEEYPAPGYKEKGDPRADTHLKLKVEYHTGSSWASPHNKATLIEKDIPMPASFTPEVLYKLFTDTIKEVLDKIEGMTFYLPDGDKGE